jgi:hypothetical protein
MVRLDTGHDQPNAGTLGQTLTTEASRTGVRQQAWGHCVTCGPPLAVHTWLDPWDHASPFLQLSRVVGGKCQLGSFAGLGAS